MKNHFISSLIFLFFSFSMYAQDSTCGTTINEQATTYDFVQELRATTAALPRTTANEIPIKIHIIGTSIGSLAVDSSVVMDELEIVNEAFASIDIEFVPCGTINYIYNDNYVTFTKTVDEVLCDIHDVPGVLNIYFPPNVERQNGDDICGYAYNFDIKPRVFVDKGCANNGSTLTHELGHSFSLLHTHSSSNGDELANGSNCSSAGDLLCDTPADPRLSDDVVDNNCQYIGTELDSQQNPYMPSVENIMSYAPKVCRLTFTMQQLEQMEAYYIVEGGFLECLDDLPTDTKDLSVFEDIYVYPNPGQGSIFIEGLSGKVHLEMINIEGKRLLVKDYDASSDQLEISEFSTLNAGIYYLQMTSNYQTTTQRVVRF